MIEQHRNADGTYDGVGVIAEMSGLPRGTALQLLAQVQENHARLQACPYHEFSPVAGDPAITTPRKRYRCIECGGELDATAYHWHQQGRRPAP